MPPIPARAATAGLCLAALCAAAQPTQLSFGEAVSSDGKRIRLLPPRKPEDELARVRILVRLPGGRRCSYEGTLGAARAPVQPPQAQQPDASGVVMGPSLDPAARYAREIRLRLPPGSRLAQCQLAYGTGVQAIDIEARPLDPSAPDAQAACRQFCNAGVSLSGHYAFAGGYVPESSACIQEPHSGARKTGRCQALFR